jgi:SAM-dependent methyltransferase
VGTEREKDGVILRTEGGNEAGIDLERLASISKRPKLYENIERVFWADPYVSEHVLWAHLNSDNDDASRQPEKIDRSVAFMLEKLAAGRSDGDSGRGTSPIRVLDLGCGPGLYAERLAASGCTVTGIDLSPASISHARRKAKSSQLPITYLQENMHEAEFDGPYDLVLLIYGEFGTFHPAQQERLLRRILEALTPGGMLILDVFTKRYVDRIRGGNDWYVRTNGGFWQDDAHLVLEQTFRYPSDSASVVRYTIVDGDGAYRQYSVWWHHFRPSEITGLVESIGFTRIELYGSVWGSPLRSDSEWIGLTCFRPE